MNATMTPKTDHNDNNQRAAVSIFFLFRSEYPIDFFLSVCLQALGVTQYQSFLFHESRERILFRQSARTIAVRLWLLQYNCNSHEMACA